ncbi:MAG: hypothetical protein KDA99_02290, partial [Planctomycetales bacterium]|nr:hypothetical protein [Planctomycetales bacterium]
GHTLRLKIVDHKQVPIRGVRVVSDTWGELRTLNWNAQSDDNGECIWQGAPADPVELHILKADYIAIRDFSNPPRDEPYLVEMLPVVNITGLVVDRQAGNPIADFVAQFGDVYEGRESVTWNDWQVAKGKNGLLTMRRDEPARELHIRVDAEGYKSWISPPIDMTQSNVAISVELEKDLGLTGRIIRPDGQPADGAKVVMVTPEHPGNFPQGLFGTVAVDEQAKSTPSTLTTEHGEFRLPGPAQPSVLLIIHDAGYFEMATADVGIAPIKLEAWASLNLGVVYAGQPCANAKVRFYPTERRLAPDVHAVDYGQETSADRHGKVDWKTVIPRAGQLSVGRHHSDHPDRVLYEHRKIELQPGKTFTLEVGKQGRTVRGKIVLPQSLSMKNHKWETVILSPADRERSPTITAWIANDLTFEYDAIPAGEYRMHASLVEDNEQSRRGFGQPVARVDHRFSVDDRSSGPLDLGEIQVQHQREE